MFGPQVQPSPEMKKISTGLYMIFFAGLILSFCKFAGGSFGSSLALNEIIACLLFICGIYSYNYCLIVVYVVLVLFDEFQILMIIGKDIQNSSNPFAAGKSGGEKFFYSILIITFVYNIVACVFCFKAYRIFKYESLKGMMGGAGAPIGGNTNNNNNQNQNQNRGNNFSGQGVRIG